MDPGLSFGQKQPEVDHSEGLYWLPAVLLTCHAVPALYSALSTAPCPCCARCSVWDVSSLMRFNASSCCRHSDASMVTTFPICFGGGHGLDPWRPVLLAWPSCLVVRLLRCSRGAVSLPLSPVLLVEPLGPVASSRRRPSRCQPWSRPRSALWKMTLH